MAPFSFLLGCVQSGLGAASRIIHGLFQGYTISVGCVKHDLGIPHPDLLPREHPPGKAANRPSLQPALSPHQERTNVHYERAFSRTSCVRTLCGYGDCYACIWSTGI